MLCTLIDIGSNTVKMSVFECKKSFFSLEYKTSRMCRLISYIKNSVMDEEGISILVSTIKEFIEISQSKNVFKIFAFATASLRGARNSGNIIERVKKETEIDIELISPSDEALLSFTAVYEKTVKNKSERGITADMGGGSTEFVFFNGEKVEHYNSLGVGCLSLYNEFVSDIIPDQNEWRAIKEYVRGILTGFRIEKNYSSTLYIVGGSGRALALLCMDMRGVFPDDDNGFEMNVSDYWNLREKYLNRENAGRLKLLLPERYIITLPALAAYESIFEYTGVAKTITSSAGMREGYMRKLIERGFIGA